MWYGPQMDPEILAQHKLEMQDQNLAFWRLLEEVSEPQLMALRDLLSYTVQHPEFGVHGHGIATARLKWEFNYCFCEEPIHLATKHTDELLPATVSEGEPEAQKDVPEYGTWPCEPDLREGHDGEFLPEYYTQEDTELLDTYNMQRNPDTDYAKQVRCKKCKSQYVSLADRILKSPNDCHHCQIMEAHGGIDPWS